MSTIVRHVPGQPATLMASWVLETGPAGDDSLVVAGDYELGFAPGVIDGDLTVTGGTGQCVHGGPWRAGPSRGGPGGGPGGVRPLPAHLLPPLPPLLPLLLPCRLAAVCRYPVLHRAPLEPSQLSAAPSPPPSLAQVQGRLWRGPAQHRLPVGHQRVQVGAGAPRRAAPRVHTRQASASPRARRCPRCPSHERRHRRTPAPARRVAARADAPSSAVRLHCLCSTPSGCRASAPSERASGRGTRARAPRISGDVGRVRPGCSRRLGGGRGVTRCVTHPCFPASPCHSVNIRSPDTTLPCRPTRCRQIPSPSCTRCCDRHRRRRRPRAAAA